jgi:hypothetical protein
MAELATRMSSLASRLTPHAAKRALAVGAIWGATMAAGLTLLGYWEYGAVCLGDAVLTTVMAVAAGVIAIGPLAMFGRTRDA